MQNILLQRLIEKVENFVWINSSCTASSVSRSKCSRSIGSLAIMKITQQEDQSQVSAARQS